MTGCARFFLYAGSLHSGWTDVGGSGNRVARYSRHKVVSAHQPLHLAGGARLVPETARVPQPRRRLTAGVRHPIDSEVVWKAIYSLQSLPFLASGCA
jgi:hypothetical protein